MKLSTQKKLPLARGYRRHASQDGPVRGLRRGAGRRATQYYDTGSSSDSAALPMRRAELRDMSKLLPATKGTGGRNDSFDDGGEANVPPRGNRQSSPRQWHWGAAGSGSSYASEGEGEMTSGTLSPSTESSSGIDIDSSAGSSGSDSRSWNWSGSKLWSRVESSGDLSALLKGVGGDAGEAGNRGGQGCGPVAMRRYARAIVGAVALAALVVSGLHLVTEAADKSMFSTLPTSGGGVFESLLRKRDSNNSGEGEGVKQEIQLMYRSLPGGGSVVDVAAGNVLEDKGNASDREAVPLTEIRPEVPLTKTKPAVGASQPQPQEHEHKPKYEKEMSALERNRLEHLEKWKDMN